MPDWRPYLEVHLRRLPLSPSRREEILAELAEQMEDAYQAALATGASAAEAARRAEAAWGFSHILLDRDRSRGGVRKRTPAFAQADRGVIIVGTISG